MLLSNSTNFVKLLANYANFVKLFANFTNFVKCFFASTNFVKLFAASTKVDFAQSHFHVRFDRPTFLENVFIKWLLFTVFLYSDHLSITTSGFSGLKSGRYVEVRLYW